MNIPRKLTHAGFSVVLILIILTVIAALSLAGWFVWQKNKDEKVKRTQDGQQSNGDPRVGTQSNPSEMGKYLVIEEWGVRFPLPAELRGDIYYKTFASDVFADEGAIFGSKGLDSLVHDGSCSLDLRSDGTIGPGLSLSLSRIKPQSRSTESLTYYRSQRTLLAQSGGYEYYYVKPSKNPLISCVYGNRDDLAGAEKAIRDKLVSALSGLEAVK